MIKSYSFFDQLKAVDKSEDKIIKIINKYFSGEKIRKSNLEEDIKGIDYFAGENKIDIKLRNINYPGDVALEIWSNCEKKTIGWTLDNIKITDYVLFIWKDKDLIIPYKKLREVFKKNYADWVMSCRTIRNRTVNTGHSYTSMAVFIPVLFLLEEIVRNSFTSERKYSKIRSIYE